MIECFHRWAKVYHFPCRKEEELVELFEDLELRLVDGTNDSSFATLGNILQGLYNRIGSRAVQTSGWLIQEQQL